MPFCFPASLSSLFIPLKGKYHREFGRYSKDREWAERERERETQSRRERESIRAKKRGKERRARTKTLSHLIFGWRFLFAVNNLSLPLSLACSASDRHIYLMQMSIKYVEKKEKEQWLFKNDTYKLSLLRIRKPSCHSCLQVRKTNRGKKHYISVLLFTGDCRSTPRGGQRSWMAALQAVAVIWLAELNASKRRMLSAPLIKKISYL